VKHEKQRDHEVARYVISVASRLVGVPAHTLRAYEKADLIRPDRTQGNMRLYSDADISLLQRIAELADQGVNTAGIKIILEMEGRLPDGHDGQPARDN
jgi:MerR family transcriptional regulator/heat shock protein HspR